MPSTLVHPVRRTAVTVAAGLLAVLCAPLVSATPAAGASLAQQARAGEWWLDTMDVRKAWSVTKGAGVTIAVIDSGVLPTVPEMKGAVVPGADFSNGRGTPDGETPVVPHTGFGNRPNYAEAAHGTQVATMAAGRGNGAGGVLGVAPEAKIMPLSVFTGQPAIGSDDYKKTYDSCNQAEKYAVDHGARVLNLSISNNCGDGAVYAVSKGALVFTATGNDGLSEAKQVSVGGFARILDSPADERGVVAVGGVLKDRSISPYSTFGRPTFSDAAHTGKQDITYDPKGAGPMLTAGVALTGPYADKNLQGFYLPDLSGSYERNQGTSFASPAVAGIAALILSKYPKMSAADVISRMLTTATKPPTSKAIPDEYFGFGIPDAYRALTTDTPHLENNPLGVPNIGCNGCGHDNPIQDGVWGTAGLTALKAKAGAVGSAEFAEGKPAGTGASPGSGSSAAAGSGSSSYLYWVALVVAVAALAIAMLLWRHRRQRAAYPSAPAPAWSAPYAPPMVGPPPQYAPPPPGAGGQPPRPEDRREP